MIPHSLRSTNIAGHSRHCSATVMNTADGENYSSSKTWQWPVWTGPIGAANLWIMGASQVKRRRRRRRLVSMLQHVTLTLRVAEFPTNEYWQDCFTLPRSVVRVIGLWPPFKSMKNLPFPSSYLSFPAFRAQFHFLLEMHAKARQRFAWHVKLS